MNYNDGNYTLNQVSLDRLDKLLTELDQHNGTWTEDSNEEAREDGVYVYKPAAETPLVREARRYLYEHKLIVDFDWSAWEEGREFFKSNDPDKYAALNKEKILKLLTAVVRNDHFNEGAWADLFENGIAQKLLKRLLELHKP